MTAKTTFKTAPLKTGKVAVLRVTRHYPKGMMVHKVHSQAQADEWVVRQTAEDVANRLAKVQAYLAERAARPVPVKVDDGQLTMF